MPEFIFATGIECSCPTIEHGRWRRDQLAETKHYQYWRRDLAHVRELGLKYLRYGPPLHLIYLGEDRYEWSFMDAVAAEMRRLGIIPIIDLCHFGVPHWIGNFQNRDFPALFARYAAAFARRYGWVRLYTPVNEMYVASRSSALDGIWNEQLRSERAFVTAVRNVAKASVLAMQAIQRERSDAVFINSESSEFSQPCCPDREIVRIADFENQRRFLALDLMYAHPIRDDVRAYLFDNGLSPEEYDWFMSQDVRERSVLGVDYYQWNEKLIDKEGRPESLGELFGWYVITKQYYERYQRTIMHTETNCPDASEAPAWIWRQWHNVQLIRHDGVPVVGFTWYSLQDQVDWDVGLRKALGNVFPVGLYDLNRDPRPVAQAYKQLIGMFGREPLPDTQELAPLQSAISGQ